MKKSKMNMIVFLLFIIVFSGCNQTKTDANVEAEKEAVKEVIFNRYFKGANENNLDLFMTAWADNAIRMEPGFFSIVGKEKIKAHFKNIFDSLDSLKISQYGNFDVEVSGDFAFGRGAVTIKGISKVDGSNVFMDMKFLDIYKKRPDGTWEIYIDHSSNNPVINEEPVDSGRGEELSDPAL